MKKLLLTLVVLMMLAGCAKTEVTPTIVEPTVTAMPVIIEPTLEPTPVPTLIPTPGIPAAPQGLNQYALDATLDYGAKTLQAAEQVSYVNHTGVMLTELVFIVHPSRFAFVFEYQSAFLGDGRQLFNETLEKGKLILPLPEVLNPDEMVTLTINFRLVLPEREGTLGYTARQVNLANFFPILPPYVAGQGWLTHEPGGFGEYMVFDAADFDVRFKMIGDGLVAAASAYGQPDGEWLHYQLKGARNFAVSVSPYFRTKEAMVGSARVTSYWFTDNDDAGDAALQTAVQAVTLFNELFGVYPREALSVVESDFLHGMEYDGMFFLSRGFYENYPGNAQSNLVIIGAHETSHQWFYSLVANDQALEPWLDEALATYCELLYYEKYHPDLTGWWWDNRVKFFTPGGWVDGNIYNPEGYEKYRNGVYLRGALFFGDLRGEIGDEAFFAFLKDYARMRAYTIVTRADFFEILKQHTTVDLTDLVGRYFEQPMP